MANLNLDDLNDNIQLLQPYQADTAAKELLDLELDIKNAAVQGQVYHF